MNRQVGPCVLIVDDEPSVLEIVARWLETARLVPVCVRTARDAVRIAQDRHVSAAIVDYRLDRSDGLQLGITLRTGLGLPFILISGYLDIALAVQAMKFGAVDVVTKPLSADRLVPCVERALLLKQSVPFLSDRICLTPTVNSPRDLSPAVTRWARMVLAVCGSEYDPRTVELWGREVGLSTSTIEGTCHLCGVQTHDARDFGRFARSIARNKAGSTPLRDHFAVADQRTLVRLFQKAGLSFDASSVSLRDFLTEQGFVPKDAPCLREFAHLAANSGVFF